MKLVMSLLLTGLIACSSSSRSNTAEPSLNGNWMYVNAAGTAGTGISFKPDGTYVGFTLALTSSASANAEVETGNFVAKNGAITLTPEEWTCPGPDPVSTAKYSFNSGSLTIATSSGIVSLKPNNGPASDTFAISYGCFDAKTGAFKRAPLAPVANE